MASHATSSVLQRAQRLCTELGTACSSLNTSRISPVKPGPPMLLTGPRRKSQTINVTVTRRNMSSVRKPQSLNIDNMNPHVKAAKYAVRGEIPAKSEEYRDLLKKQKESGRPPTPPGESPLPFDSVINANIGNPQQLDQKPITFFRQVLSILENPALLENVEALKTAFGYKQDVIDRARWLYREIGSVGAYSQSAGVPAIRRSVANFIERRDGYPADPSSIYLSAGASSAVETLLTMICSSPETGVLVPIPQYPLYTATLAVLNARVVPYYLEEDKAWSTDIDLIRESHRKAKSEGTHVRAIVVINPGNPTGASLSEEEVKDIIKFAAEEDLVIIADEVYQTNIFVGQFYSFKKCLMDLKHAEPGVYDTVEVASLNSISKGMIGECGHRGGYFELAGFDPEVEAQILKFISISLCPPVTGQCLVELMVNPPVEGDPSYPLYHKEYNGIKDGLKKRAFALYDAFRDMEGVEVGEPQGSMYLFPTITLPEKAIEAAQREGKEPDDYYCMRLLDATGICVVPGSGFGQKAGTLHFRTTFLAPGTDWAERIVRFHESFMKEFK